MAEENLPESEHDSDENPPRSEHDSDENEPDPKEPERRVKGMAGESEALRRKDGPEQDEDEASWESFPASDAPAY
jgi:hypothetical protein